MMMASISNSISTGDELRRGDMLQSNNNLFKAVMEENGNFVVYKWQQIWKSDTAHRGSQRVVLQEDGDLVIYDKNGAALWATGTQEPGADYRRMRLTMTDIGELQVTNDGKVTWRSTLSTRPRAPNSPSSSAAASDDNPGDKLQENVYTGQ